MRVCAGCGEEYYCKPSDARKGSKYCSLGCYRENEEYVRSEKREAFWYRMRKERRGSSNPAFKHGKDGNRAWRRGFNLALKGEDACRVCGSVDGLQLHHIIPRSVSTATRDEIRNGMTLCVVCHMKWHRKTLTIYRDLFTDEEWGFLRSVDLMGQDTLAWFDRYYPERSSSTAGLVEQGYTSPSKGDALKARPGSNPGSGTNEEEHGA